MNKTYKIMVWPDNEPFEVEVESENEDDAISEAQELFYEQYPSVGIGSIEVLN